MQILYKKISFKDIEKVVSWCKKHSVLNGGPFEVYSDPAGINRIMIVINQRIVDGGQSHMGPIGTFYCNYLGPGTISLEEGPEYDTMPERFANLEDMKQKINRILDGAVKGESLQNVLGT